MQEFQGSAIRFEVREDGRVWGCLTDMAQATGKLTADYMRLKSTKDYLEALGLDMGIPITALIQYFQGGNETDSRSQGTWAIDEVVMDFAQWCSIPFRIWANRVIRDVAIQGYHISMQATSEQLEAAQKEIRQYQIERGYLLEWSPRMSIQKMRFLELINFKAEEYSPFFLDAHDRHRFVDSCYWQKLQKYQKGATIMFALIDTLLEPGKKVSVSTFGCKTVSALMAKVPYKFYRVLTIPCQGIYQKLNPLYKHLEQSVELKEKYGEVWLKYVPEKRKELKKFLNEPVAA